MGKSEHGEAVVKWITVTVLIAISLFFVLLYKNVFIKEPQGNTEDPPPIEEPIEEEPIDAPPTIVYSEFPKAALTNQYGEYYINTGGPGNDRLQDVIDYNGFYYLILETNSNGRDYNADRDSIAIAKFDYQGTLIATMTIKNSRSEYYLASKVMNSGILIAANGEGGITYYKINYNNLSYSKAVTTESYTAMRMYYTRDFILIVGTKDKTLTVTAYCDDLNRQFIHTVEFESNISLLDILPSVYGYSIIVSEGEVGYLCSINTVGELLSKRQISSSRIIKAVPIETGYAMLIKSGQTLYLRAINYSLNEVFNTPIGDGLGGDFYPLHNGYVTFIYGTGATISKHISKSGDIITYNDWDFQDVLAIQSSFSAPDGIYFYADVKSHGGTKNTRVINYTNNNLVTYSNIIGGYYQDNAVMLIIKGSLVITFMNTHSNNSNFINNYGSMDIFIFAYDKDR